MKKSIKNTIMIGMAAVLIGTSAITFSYAQINDHQGQPPMSFSQSGDRQMQGKDFGGQKPDFDNKQDNQQGGDSQQAPPSQNNQKDGNAQQAPPEQNGQQQGEQPQNGAQSQNKDGNSTKASDAETSLESEISTAENTSNQDEQKRQMPDAPQGFGQMQMPQQSSNSKFASIICYAFMAVQLAIILMIIAYLFLSKFNTLSFNQVFPEKKTEQIQTTN